MEHQTRAVLKMKNGCILKGGVGSGKTITALEYYNLREKPRKMYVITTAKKRDSLDWEYEGAMMGVLKEWMVVDSWQNISKYVDVEDAFFVFDEQRLVGTGAWTKSFYKIAKKNRWIMLSATPADVWLDLAPVFIANGFYKNITEFREEHVIYDTYVKYPKVKRYIQTGRLVKYANDVVVRMQMDRHTTRHVDYVNMPYDWELLEYVRKNRWNIYKDKPCKNRSEWASVMRRVVYSDIGRLRGLEALLSDFQRVVVFYNFDYELEALRGLQTDRPISEWNGHKHDPVPTGEEWVYLVQYTAGAEAWNCTTTNAMVFYSMTYSYRNFEQAQGRIDRVNTFYKDLYYTVFTSNSLVDKAVEKALKNKKNFNESAFGRFEG